ncbi:hypothetical protein V6N12_008978 [Hibiscus sabdariffa]|uniref:RING-type domain-containing protein n=1 Tax=Hibiscus sabdariffa TaxID=183260 RepID=A0ABR2C4B8_9ROSI
MPPHRHDDVSILHWASDNRAEREERKKLSFSLLTINMGDEKLKNVDELQNSEEIRHQSLSSETVCCTGITGVGTVDVPLNVLSNYPSFRMGDMPLAGTDAMRSAPHLDSYQSFTVYPQLLNRGDYMPSLYSPLEKTDANSECLKTAIQDIKMDDLKPQSLENFMMRSGSREHFLRGAQDGSDMGSNDNLVDCAVQSNYPESLDGSFLTLGVGVDREVRSTYNNGALSMPLNQSHSQSGYRSSFSPDFNMAPGLSDFQTYATGLSGIEENAVGLSSLKHNFGGLPSIVQNASDSSNVSALTGSSQNVDSCTFSTHDYRFAASTISNLSSSPSKMLPIPQSQVQHPCLSSGNRNFTAGFANIDPNKGFHGLSGISSNGEHSRSHSGLLPNQSFHTLSGSSSIVHGCGQSGLPFQGQQRLAPWPSLSSFVRSKYAAVTSDQLQKCDSGSILSLQRGTPVASVHRNIENTSSQSDVWQRYPAHRDAALQTVEKAPFSKRIQNQLPEKEPPIEQSTDHFFRAEAELLIEITERVANIRETKFRRSPRDSMLNSICSSTADQLFASDRSASQVGSSSPFYKNFAVQTASKDKVSATDRNAAEVVSILPSSNNIRFQEAASLGHSRNNAHIQASNNLVPAYTSGQVTPIARRIGPAAITSNNLSRSSLKRKATQPPAATPQVQIKRTEKSSARSSAVDKAQNAPYISHVPSVVHPISTVPPVRITPQPPLQATTIPPSARRFPHVKWQDRESLQPSGYNCLLCKRDLSYSPEGPILPLTAPPPVAVLSCGHCFHDLCLQRMTPKDQANNPPCIPCVIGEG